MQSLLNGLGLTHRDGDRQNGMQPDWLIDRPDTDSCRNPRGDVIELTAAHRSARTALAREDIRALGVHQWAPLGQTWASERITATLHHFIQ